MKFHMALSGKKLTNESTTQDETCHAKHIKKCYHADAMWWLCLTTGTLKDSQIVIFCLGGSDISDRNGASSLVPSEPLEKVNLRNPKQYCGNFRELRDGNAWHNLYMALSDVFFNAWHLDTTIEIEEISLHIMAQLALCSGGVVYGEMQESVPSNTSNVKAKNIMSRGPALYCMDRRILQTIVSLVNHD